MLAINVARVTNRCDEDEKNVVFDRVDNPVVADADSVEAVRSRKPFAFRRSWVGLKFPESGGDSDLSLP